MTIPVVYRAIGMELGWVLKHEIVFSKMSGISVGMSGRKVIEYGVNHQEPSYQHMFRM